MAPAAPILFTPDMLDAAQGLPPPQFVSLAVNDHPLYQEFVEPCLRSWNAVGVRPHLTVVSDRDARVDGVLHVAALPGLPTWFQAQFARLYALRHLEGVGLVSDIDLFPMDVRYFSHYASLATRDNVVLAHTRQPFQVPRYVFCYVFGQAASLVRLLGIHGTFAQFMEQVVATVPVAWQSDELFLHRRLARVPPALRVEHARAAGPGIAPYRLFRTEPPSSPVLVDFHAPRPYAEHAAYIESLIPGGRPVTSVPGCPFAR